MGPRLEDIYLRHAEAYQEETQLFDAEVREHYRMQLAEDIFSQVRGAACRATQGGMRRCRWVPVRGAQSRHPWCLRASGA